MNKLALIRRLIVLLQILLVAGSLFAAIFFSVIDDEMVVLGKPLWEVADHRSAGEVKAFLPADSGVDVEKVLLNLKIPLTTGFRFMLISLLVVGVGYLFLGLRIIGKIVREIQAQRPFSLENARRIKYFGILVALAPFLAGIVETFFSRWLGSHYELKGLNAYQMDSNGFSIFIIGLIIYVLGVAFLQGVKLQEENELTI